MGYARVRGAKFQGSAPRRCGVAPSTMRPSVPAKGKTILPAGFVLEFGTRTAVGAKRETSEQESGDRPARCTSGLTSAVMPPARGRPRAGWDLHLQFRRFRERSGARRSRLDWWLPIRLSPSAPYRQPSCGSSPSRRTRPARESKDPSMSMGSTARKTRTDAGRVSKRAQRGGRGRVFARRRRDRCPP